MSSDKRRRARVQGGWAPPTNARSDRDKPKAKVTPNWYGKTVDQPSPKKFVFETPTEVIFEERVKHFDKVGSGRFHTDTAASLKIFYSSDIMAGSFQMWVSCFGPKSVRPWSFGLGHFS